MALVPFRSRFNWRIEDGDHERQVTHSILEGPPEPIPQDTLLDPLGCLVLEPEDMPGFCEQSLDIHPSYRVVRMALIAECSAIELDVGPPRQYYETFHGSKIYDDDESRLYRFDIRAPHALGIRHLIMRFVSPQREILCLYGLHLQMERIPADVSAYEVMMQGGCHIDESRLSARAARCRAFMMSSMGPGRMGGVNPALAAAAAAAAGGGGGGPNPNFMNNNRNLPPRYMAGGNGGGAVGVDNPRLSFPVVFGEAEMKAYMDTMFKALNRNFNTKLEALEAKQNEKLDKILSLLEASKK